MDDILFFDLWYRDSWVGMSEGKTVQEARDVITRSWPKIPPDQVLMVPYYGPGTSHATFKAITGRQGRGAYLGEAA